MYNKYFDIKKILQTLLGLQVPFPRIFPRRTTGE